MRDGELRLNRSSKAMLRRWLDEPDRVWAIGDDLDRGPSARSPVLPSLTRWTSPENRPHVEAVIGQMVTAGWAVYRWGPPPPPRQRCVQLTKPGALTVHGMLAPRGSVPSMPLRHLAQVVRDVPRRRRGLWSRPPSDAGGVGGPRGAGSLSAYASAGVRATLRRDGLAAAFMAWRRRHR